MLSLTAPAAHAQSADGGDQDSGQTARPQAIEYSEGYETRAKIHRIASWATLPLLGTEAILGQQLYNDPQGRLSSWKGPHIAVGTALTGLFAVQTVTGVWNLVDAWKDPNHKTLRLVHGIMMLGADAGFAAAYATGPGGRNLVNFDQDKSTHRTVVFTTMGVAATSYLLMLFGNK
ncbi:MAG TPA: hypothetical protein VFA27_13430 [Vicinamibacterales bacterium]|nr:hypothetical protein [Vicinamibacterales bacterium]